MKTVAIVGGGNIGTQFACMCASKGHGVNLFTSKPELFDMRLEIVDEHDCVTVGELAKVTDDIGEAISGCDVVFVTHPAFMLEGLASRMLPFAKPGLGICVVPGTGGAEFAFKACVDAGATLYGLQRVPSVARLERYGKRVRCEGLRPELHVASLPSGKAGEFAGFLGSIWGIPCTALSNYLNITLTPSNPILHTARLRTLFADYVPGKVYDRNPLFYGEWSDESSRLLLACDAELQDMVGRLDGLDLSAVRSLKEHYESDTVEAMTGKLSGIKSLHRLGSPMKEVDGGWVPDFESRYFKADFPYGLGIIEQMASVIGCEMPNIRETMGWFREVSGDEGRLDLSEHGLRTISDIYALYD